MATVILVVVAAVVVLGLLVSVWLRGRQTSGRPGELDAESLSARQRQDDRQGWQGGSGSV